MKIIRQQCAFVEGFAFRRRYGCGDTFTAGIILVGQYSEQPVTMDSSYDIYYYIYDSSGNRFPTSGNYTQSETLSGGSNPITITDLVSSGAYEENFDMYLAETFNMIYISGTSFTRSLNISATLSGGSWSDILPSPYVREQLLWINTEGNSDYHGDNQVRYTFTDPNGDSFSASDYVDIRYAPEMYIVSVDGDYNVLDPIITSSDTIDFTYVYGGVFAKDINDQLGYDTSGFLAWTGGEEISVSAYQLYPAENLVVETNISDDFGNTSDTFTLTVIKTPVIDYVGLSAIGNDVHGTQYIATSGLRIDNNTPYTSYGDLTFDFDSGDYKVYDFNKTYFYPDTEVSASIDISIKYKRYQEVKILDPIEGELFNDTSPINVSWVDYDDNDINDTEDLGTHVYATNVDVIRMDQGSIDIVTVSHKTGIPVATLKSYYDNSDQEVLFDGSYVVPPEINNPIKFGWSVTNGNESGELTQSTFTQTLTLSAYNDVIMPTFTDNWGNTIPLLNRTVSVYYGVVVYESIPQMQNVIFDQIGTGEEIIEDLPQFENLIFDQIGVGEQPYEAPKVDITSPTEGQVFSSATVVDDTIVVSWTLDGVPQEDFFIFDSGLGNYQVHISYTDPTSELVGFDTVNVTYTE